MFHASFVLSVSILLSLLLSEVHGSRVLTVSTNPPNTIRQFGGGPTIITGPTTRPPTRTVRTFPENFASLVTPTPKPNPNGAMCDVWDQDCPSRYKCVAESLDKEPRCRQLDNNPDQIGDSCSTKGNNDGDTCDIDGICVNGVCREVCQGSPGAHFCNDIKDLCHIYAAGTPLCEEKCNPIIHGICSQPDSYCSMDSTSPDQRFTCMQESGQLGLQGDSCVETSQCHQGFACVLKNQLPGGFCKNGATLRCCTPLVEDGKDCPNNTVMHDFYVAPPPGLEDLGVCLFG